MKSILEVSRLVTRQKLRRVESLSAETLEATHSKIRELYDALQDGAVRTDRDAARLLYGAEPGDARYRKLKSRFRKRLTATLFLVDQQRPHRRGFDHTHHSCQREWALVNILVDAGAEEAAREAARNLLTTCRRYRFAALTAECAGLLADRAAADGDTDDAREFGRIAAEALDLHVAESSGAAALRAINLSPEADPSAAAAALPDALLAGAEPDASPRQRFDYLEARALVAERRGQLREVCTAVESFAEYATSATHLLDERRLLGLRFRQLHALLASTDRLGFGRVYAATAPLVEAGSAAWHRLCRLRAIEALRHRDWAAARQEVAAAQRHRGMRQAAAPEREAWAILGALAETLDPSATPATAPSAACAPFARGYERLAAWRMIADTLRLHRLGEVEACDAQIAELRGFVVKRIKRTEHPGLYSLAQWLNRRARAGFADVPDRIAERHLGDLRAQRCNVDARPTTFTPITPAGLLPLFGA